jgi:small subunit ribosomal protein S18
MGRRRSSGPRSSFKKSRGFKPRKRKVCYFCMNLGTEIDFKDIDLMRKFMSDRGKIMPRRRTGTCPKHQREVARNIKKAREIAIVPYFVD